MTKAPTTNKPEFARAANVFRSVGIRKGHASALMAVASGAVTAFSAGKQVFSRSMEGGLATVEGDRVTILAFETETV